jgi:3-hydroxyisobutyrate dehydrogenase
VVTGTIRAGVVGLGAIGGGLAGSLVRAALPTVVFDVDPEAIARQVERGAVAVASLRELAERTDVVSVAVRDDTQVREVLLGSSGLLATARRGAVVAIHSTVAPATVRELAATAAASGVELLDAPVTGGEHRAADGTLCLMVGGSEAALERAAPVFAAIAGEVVRCGAVGDAAVVKLCVNLIGYQAFVATDLGFDVAERAGVPLAALAKAAGASGYLTEPARMVALGKRARAQDPERARRLRSVAGLADKDLALAIEIAEAMGLDVRPARLCRELIARAFGVENTEDNHE